MIDCLPVPCYFIVINNIEFLRFIELSQVMELWEFINMLECGELNEYF